MAKTILHTLSVLLIINLVSCQYPVDSSILPNNQRFLVIDAELTDDYGKVSVNYTLSDVTPQGGYVFPDPPAAVAYVLDGHGNRTDFTTDGVKNTSFKGVVGEAYKLYVETGGQKYESIAEIMPACPELDSVTPIYSRETFRSPDDLYYDGFDVYARLTDVPGQENYYQWDWIHYARQFSCGIAVENGTEVLIPCTPYDCWSITYNSHVVVQSDKLRDGQPVAQKIVRVPFAKPPQKYYLRVEQRAITPTAYAYLQSIQTQTQSTGTMFDIPAQTKFNPNVFNVNNPSEQLLGVFNVFSSRHKIIYIDMLQHIEGAEVKIFPQKPYTSNPLAQSPCTEGPYRTQIKPEGWED